MPHPIFLVAAAAGAYLGYRYVKKQAAQLDAKTGCASQRASESDASGRPTLRRDPDTGVYRTGPSRES